MSFRLPNESTGLDVSTVREPISNAAAARERPQVLGQKVLQLGTLIGAVERDGPGTGTGGGSGAASVTPMVRELAVFRLSIYMGELCAKEEDLSRVIDPHH